MIGHGLDLWTSVRSVVAPFTVATTFSATGCADESACCASLPQPDSLAVEIVTTGLNNPVALTAPVNDARLFVVEQPGRIRVVEGGALLSTSFLDITNIVGSGGERGLLGLAFHPAYASNGQLFVYYTNTSGDTRVARYTVSSDPNVANPASASTILAVAQPYGNHNGGAVAFGPGGYLYIALGDGGSAGDPDGNGQDSTTLLGSILRIDVDGGSPYVIPPDNPFAGHPTARPEIWAYGLRNPWRFSFDAVTDQVYVGDVGQGQWEEIDVVARVTTDAYNFGWNPTEGAHCYQSSSCDMRGITLPVLEYDHGEGCSVAGGHVYRGSAIDGLQGTYFYSDYCSGWLRSFNMSGETPVGHQQWDVAISGRVLSFGEDADGELYVLSDDGTVYRIIIKSAS